MILLRNIKKEDLHLETRNETSAGLAKLLSFVTRIEGQIGLLQERANLPVVGEKAAGQN